MARRSPASRGFYNQEDPLRHKRRRKVTDGQKPQTTQLATSEQVTELRAEMIRFGVEVLALSQPAAQQRADIIAGVYSDPPRR